MKFGARKPSLKKSFKAKTTGKAKRQLKKSINPLYGKKGMGWVNDPKKAAYNKVYNKTSFSATDGLKNHSSSTNTDDDATATCLGCGCAAFIMIILVIIIFFIL
ncbi:TPA: hypothetical protein ACF2DS_002359 [Clostridium perfringens]|uniref:hypothetical protein n=1 Tax=Clostridium perfringens TaxID=1502 RepID=UPI0018AAE054|nr:hypothetical protein [Clostridium perfringens]QTZ82797.1 hypothetical protein phiCpA_00025 [Clostridium phage phiCp-A]EHR1331921.1 hypothetical protein [Clostridium perfringens]EHR1425398.1 hypothetical protein [Clostridium perfringens]EIF6165315.1 hypothetical protein [Clostridium perfringens]